MTTRYMKSRFMQGILLITFFLIAAANTSYAAGQTPLNLEQVATGEKIPLKILYVGLPDTERQKDFVEFLSGYFTEVKTADYNNCKEEQTEDSDVVIFDKDGIEWKSLDIKVSEKYDKATIAVGVPGAFWNDRMGLKTGYM